MSRHLRRSRTRRRRHAALAGASAIAALGLGASAAEAATFTVTSTGDAGAGSLRDAISQANAAGGLDTIRFASSVTGTIHLLSTLDVTSDLDIDGPGAGTLTLSGLASDPVLKLASTTAGDLITDEVSGLTLSGGTFGVYGMTDALTLDAVVISGNGSATAFGGGVYDTGASLTVEHSTITGNRTDGNGGGVNAAYLPVLTISDSTVSGNTAASRGGGIAAYGDERTRIESSTVSGNSAADGGGLYVYGDAPALLSGLTVTGNKATTAGGGIATAYVESDIEGSTVTANSAPKGGGVFAENATVPLMSSAVAGNTGDDLETANGGTFSATASLVQNPGAVALGAGAITGRDPLLGPLQDNGGETLTQAPLFGSPLLDAGTASDGGPASDQRGLHRTVDLPGVANASDGTDIGAVEAQSAPPDPNAPPPAAAPASVSTVTVTTPAPPPPPPPPPPVIRCVVPKLAGLSLASAKRKLTAAHCTAGTVHKPKGHTPHGRTLVVKATTPAAAGTAASGARVSLTLTRVRKKR